MPVPIRYATTQDGVRIAYMSLGDGPAIVFASNIFGDLTGYRLGWPHIREVTDRLVKLGWRVIRHDVRGMGHSDRHVADVGLSGRVLDVQAVVARLELDRFTLAGLDIGAATAVAYAAANHEKISRLVLLSPWPAGARYLQIPALRAAYSAEHDSNRDPELFANMLSGVATGFVDAELIRIRTAWHLHGTSPEELVAYDAANARIDIGDQLRTLPMPTLVVHEPAFPFGSFDLCQDVAASIPAAELLIVGDQSITGRVHDETVAAIDRFVRGGPTGGTSLRAGDDATAAARPAPHGLTPREVQILRRVAEGSRNKEIAGELGLAVSTVERHLLNLYTKIGARGRAGAIAFALRHRI
jgi:pimeloyl-ACP methyl ester carboxylesterase/DNA-binding CsgD family transcriptional regulator